jgi:hypothetical protein
MPAYNVAKAVEDTFRRIPEGYYDEVILANDYSWNDTTELAKRLNLKAPPEHAALHLRGHRGSPHRPGSSAPPRVASQAIIESDEPPRAS